jgi:DNA polymerase IV
MSLKRPSTIINVSSNSSPSLKRKKSDTVSSASRANSILSVNGSPIKVYIVEAKLDTQKLFELVSLVESRSNRDRKLKNTASEGASEFLLELCPDVQKADVVITAVQMRRRFERHVDWGLAVSSKYPLRFIVP